MAASAGNHAQAVACAARDAGARAVLVMPEEAPLAKVAAVRQYGGEVRLHGGNYDDAHAEAARLARGGGPDRGARLRRTPRSWRARARSGWRSRARRPTTQAGGGAARRRRPGRRRSALAVAAWLPGARVVGVQAEACAPYIDSLAAHRPIGARSANTICDGIAVKRPGDFTLPLVERYVDEVVTVSDDEVAEAMVLLLERTKLVVEGAGAVAVAALMQGRVAAPAGGRRSAPCCRAATSTPRCCRSASGWARPPPAAAWCCRRSCPTGRAPWPGCCAWWPSTAATWSTSSTCATASTCTCARRRSSWCSRPAGRTPARRSSTPPRAQGFSVRVERQA